MNMITKLMDFFGIRDWRERIRKVWKEYSIDSYVKEESPKHKVVLHHTAGPTGISAIRTFKRYKTISTPYIIDRGGTIYVLYDDKYWSYHLGIKKNSILYVGIDDNANVINTRENKHSIGIELVSWGPIYKDKDGKFYSWAGKVVNPNEVYEIEEHTAFGKRYDHFKVYPNSKKFREEGVVGKPVKYYHAYTIEQLISLYSLLMYLAEKHGYHLLNIHTDNVYELFYPSELPYESKDGIFTHAGYRYDKSDPFPQKQLVALLEEIKSMSNNKTVIS